MVQHSALKSNVVPMLPAKWITLENITLGKLNHILKEKYGMIQLYEKLE